MNRLKEFRKYYIIVLTFAVTALLHAQDPFQDAIRQLSSDNVRGYIQPLVNAVGANLNSGFYHTAEISESGISFQFQLVAMGTLIGDGEKTYDAVAPQPYDQTPTKTATVFGDLGSSVNGPAPGLAYHFENGELHTSIVPFATPQVTIGNIFGTQAVVRYVPVPKIGDVPKITIFGIGARHSISRYLPAFPANLSAGIFYEKLTIGDIIDAHALNFGGQISKSFSIATLYGGLSYQTSTLTLDYTYVGVGATPNSKVHIDLNADNSVCLTAGLALDLVALHLNGDINVGKITAVTAGIGFGL